MSAINQPDDRTKVYQDSPFQFVDNTGNRRLAFIQNWNFTPNMTAWDSEQIDTAAPIFTKKSDVLGTFSFNTVNTVDFFDPGSALSPITYAYWATQIALGKPPTITILATMRAEESTGNQFANILYDGRIMNCPFDRVKETGTHEFIVNGEIINITEVDRTVS